MDRHVYAPVEEADKKVGGGFSGSVVIGLGACGVLWGGFGPCFSCWRYRPLTRHCICTNTNPPQEQEQGAKKQRQAKRQAKKEQRGEK